MGFSDAFDVVSWPQGSQGGKGTYAVCRFPPPPSARADCTFDGKSGWELYRLKAADVCDADGALRYLRYRAITDMTAPDQKGQTLCERFDEPAYPSGSRFITRCLTGHEAGNTALGLAASLNLLL